MFDTCSCQASLFPWISQALPPPPWRCDTPVTQTRRGDTKWSMHRQPCRNNVFYLYIDCCLTMSFNLFQLEIFGNQDYDWGVKTGIIDRPSIRMRGQLCDGRIGRTAVIEQGHHRKKTAAVEMERIEANLRVPWFSKSTAQDTTTLARPHWNHGSKQSFKGARFSQKILTNMWYAFSIIYSHVS